MYSYFAFGLGIQSELTLPELVTKEGPCEVAISIQENIKAFIPPADQPGWLKVARQEVELYLEKVGVFRIRDGKEVLVIPYPGVNENLIRLVLLGPVMGVLLFQRGKLALHASCVGINGRGAAFLAGSGLGKSSLAAAFYLRGHSVISDDIVSIELSGDQVCAYPGYAQIKVNPEVVTSLGLDRDLLVPLDPNGAKRGWPVTKGFEIEPYPLKRIYVLTEDGEPGITSLNPNEAVMQLVSYTYPTAVLQIAGAQHLLQCSELARRVPVFRIARAPELSAISDFAALVEADLLPVKGTV